MINQYNRVLSAASQRQEILESTAYMLHSIDVKKSTFDFLQTTRETLSDTSFIDGRSPLSVDETVWQVPFDEAMAWHARTPKTEQPNRFVFHTSFCGSTLLARVLDIEGKAFSYKEPNILLQLAQIKAKETQLYCNRSQWRKLIGFVLDQFKNQWNTSEPTIIKPSNWVNSMLTELMLDNDESRAVLLSSTPEEYLTAVFRGGSERVQYTYSLLRHLSTAFPEYAGTISEVEDSQAQTVDLFMRLSLIAYAIQQRAFCRIRSLVDSAHRLDCRYNELINDTPQCLEKIAQRLDLKLSPIALDRSIEDNFKYHSKVNNRQFSASERDAVNAEVYSQYQSSFDAALDWYRAKFEHS